MFYSVMLEQVRSLWINFIADVSHLKPVSHFGKEMLGLVHVGEEKLAAAASLEVDVSMLGGTNLRRVGFTFLSASVLTEASAIFSVEPSCCVDKVNNRFWFAELTQEFDIKLTEVLSLSGWMLMSLLPAILMLSSLILLSIRELQLLFNANKLAPFLGLMKDDDKIIPLVNS